MITQEGGFRQAHALPQRQRAKVQVISQEGEGFGHARIYLAPGVAELRATALNSSTKLIEGTIKVGFSERLEHHFMAQDHAAILELTSRRRRLLSFPHAERPFWDLGLSRSIPLALTVAAAAAKVDLDLSLLRVTDLCLTVG